MTRQESKLASKTQLGQTTCGICMRVAICERIQIVTSSNRSQLTLHNDAGMRSRQRRTVLLGATRTCQRSQSGSRSSALTY
eukprot:365990-Chlamydomonas_euryale.AAC.19